jgi:hypothetical protein
LIPCVLLDWREHNGKSSDETPVNDRGWQQATEAVYPFKIDLLRVNDGDDVYIDEDPARPLHIAHLAFRANNILRRRRPAARRKTPRF